MTTQILLTLEFDQSSELAPGAPYLHTQISPPVILGEVNSVVRQWASTNPFGLRDPEHLQIKLATAETVTVSVGHGQHLASDLRKIAGDLTALANITENL